MAMTKNIRTTINAVSKLFAITKETHNLMAAVKNSDTINESIEAAKTLSILSKRVDRLCTRLGFDREVVDEIFLMSDDCEDAFILHILTTNEYAFSAYTSCVIGGEVNKDESTEETAD